MTIYRLMLVFHFYVFCFATKLTKQMRMYLSIGLCIDCSEFVAVERYSNEIHHHAVDSNCVDCLDFGASILPFII